MRVVIHQPDFMPWEGFWDKAYAADVVVLWPTIQFARRDYHHRVRLGGDWLTLPIRKAPQTALIRDMKLRSEDMPDFTLDYLAKTNSLPSSPLKSTFHDMFLFNDGSLASVTVSIIEYIAIYLGICDKFVTLNTIAEGGTPEERLLSILEPYGSGEYLVGSGAYNYLGDMGSNWKVLAPTYNREMSDESILPMLCQGVDMEERFSKTVWGSFK